MESKNGEKKTLSIEEIEALKEKYLSEHTE